MRIPISLFTIALSCVLSQAASINWTNHVANIQAETNAYVGTSVNVGAGFSDARLYPDSGPAVTPFRLQSTALRLAGNIFEVSNGPGFLILSLDYTGLLSAPDLLLTGDASVQGAVLTDHVVATNGVYVSGYGDGWIGYPTLTDMEGGTVNGMYATNRLGAPVAVAVNYLTNWWTDGSVIFSAGWNAVNPLNYASNNATMLSLGDYAGSADPNFTEPNPYYNLAGDIINFGSHAGVSQSIDASGDVYNFGLWAGNSQVLSNAFEVYNIGSQAGSYQSIRNSGLDYESLVTMNIGQYAGNAQILENATNVLNFGAYAGWGQKLTNSDDIINFGRQAKVADGSKVHTVALGSYAVATNSNDYVFGDTNYNYQFPGASTHFAGTVTMQGDAEVEGTVRAGGLVSTNAATVNNLVATNGVYTGGQTNTGVTIHTPSAIQTLAAGTVIAWDSSTERVAGSGGAVTLTGTPTIQTNNVPDGALITIRGTSDANTVTLQDYRLLAGTCVAMEMGLVTLKNGSEIRFQWSAANQKWQQIAFSANSSQTHVFANLTVQTNLVVTNSISCAGAITTTSGGNVNVAGNVNGSGAVRAGTSSQIYWNLRSQMIAPGDGAIAIKNNGGGSYGNLWLRNIEFSEFETLSDVAPSSVALNLTNAYYKLITLTNDTTFTVSNAALGRGCAVWITCDASPHNITLPAWHVLNVAAPASIAANKVAVISILYKDGTDANAIATISVEP